MALSSLMMAQRHRHIQPGKRVQRLAQHAGRQVGRQAQLGHRQRARRTAFDDGLDHAGDACHLVAGTLQVLRGARDRHQETQVARRGLAPADGGDDLVIDVHLHLVDAVLGLDHLLGRFQAHVDQRVHRLVQLRFHQPAHFEHVGRDGIQLGVELAGDVFVAHVFAPADQPKRPVM